MGLKNAGAVYEFKALVTAQAEAQDELEDLVASESWDEVHDIIEGMERRAAQLKEFLEETETEVE